MPKKVRINFALKTPAELAKRLGVSKTRLARLVAIAGGNNSRENGRRSGHAGLKSKNKSVILSAVAVSRSEAATESKDPCVPQTSVDVSGNPPPRTRKRPVSPRFICQPYLPYAPTWRIQSLIAVAIRSMSWRPSSPLCIITLRERSTVDIVCRIHSWDCT